MKKNHQNYNFLNPPNIMRPKRNQLWADDMAAFIKAHLNRTKDFFQNLL